MTSLDTLDESLLRLAERGPEYDDGMSNHGPMAAEAMGVLGIEPRTIDAWVGHYIAAKLHEDPGSGGKRLASGDLPLGDFGRFMDWQVSFEADLAEAPWEQVLARWWPVLLPGAAAAATHGLIRTGHAVRSLAAIDTPARRAELAKGLAYWAARWQQLPGVPRLDGPLAMGAALSAVPPMSAPPGARGNIADRLAQLGDVPGFEVAVRQLGAGPDPSAALSALTAAAARLQPTHAHGASIAIVHALTGPAAARLALPHLPQALHGPTLAAGWHVVAGVFSAYDYVRHDPVVGPDLAWPDLVERAVASGDEHAIKYVEAARREDLISPDPAYRQAVSAFVQGLTP